MLFSPFGGFCLDKIGKGVILNLRVRPNSSRFEAGKFDAARNELRVKVCSPAQDGKANRELIKELEKFFGSRIEILRGEKSSTKTIVVRAGRENVLAKIAPAEKP